MQTPVEASATKNVRVIKRQLISRCPNLTSLSKQGSDSLQNSMKLCYATALWRSESGLPAYARPFLHEVSSLSVQALQLITEGRSRMATISLRALLEDALHYVYFLDHPVEFIKWGSDSSWHQPPKTYREYISWHPRLGLYSKQSGLYAGIERVYSQLSGAVHGSNSSIASFVSDFNPPIFNHDLTVTGLKEYCDVLEIVNHLLLASLTGTKCSLTANEWDYIKGRLPATVRSELTNL